MLDFTKKIKNKYTPKTPDIKTESPQERIKLVYQQIKASKRPPSNVHAIV